MNHTNSKNGKWLTPAQTGLQRTRDTWASWREFCPMLGRGIRSKPDPENARRWVYSSEDVEAIKAKIIDAVDQFKDADGTAWSWVEKAGDFGANQNTLARWARDGRYPGLDYVPQPQTRWVPGNSKLLHGDPANRNSVPASVPSVTHTWLWLFVKNTIGPLFVIRSISGP